MAGKFEIYEDRAGKWRFRLRAGNGEIVASGEAYKTKAAARKGTESVQRASDGARVFDLDTGEDIGGVSGPDPREYRVGSHYGIHIYAVNPDGQDDEPIASFLGDPDVAGQRAQQMVDKHAATLERDEA